MLVQVYVPEGEAARQLPDNERHNHQVVRIDGVLTATSKCTGYCSNNLHKGYLTKQLMQKHNCIGNECSCFFKRIREDKKPLERKTINIQKEEILSCANELLKDYEGIVATGIIENDNYYILKYAQVCNCDSIVKETEKQLYAAFGTLVVMENIRANFDVQYALIMGC